MRDLRGFLQSEVFGPMQWSTAASAKNGRNPRFRYGNDAPKDLSRIPTGSSRFLPRHLETRTQRGFPHFHSDDGCGVPSAMKMNSAKIAGLARFLHRAGLRMRGKPLKMCEMVAREGVEPPTPAFSGLVYSVL